jgi:hypothetical protein
MSARNLLLSLTVMLVMFTPAGLTAQEEEGGQDRETMAIDSTATQWSFQFAYQTMPRYHQDTMDNGLIRPKGNEDYWQLRVVAPIPKSESVAFTMLPRLTIRLEENQQEESGFGSTELFVLGIVDDWGTGRWGIGPLVNFPGSTKVGSDKWGFGLAGTIVNTSGPWFYGVLLTQSWRERDPTLVSSGIAPLGIAPFLNYQLGKGFYVGNGDMVARWDWDNSALYLPIGVRLGKVIVKEKASWNIYGEYQTSLYYDEWMGSAVKDSWRLNVTYTIPVGL